MRQKIATDIGALLTTLGYITFEQFSSLIGLIITITVGIPTAILKWMEFQEKRKARKEQKRKNRYMGVEE